MVFHKHIPASPLNSYIDCIIYIEGNNKGIGFPKTAMSLVFNLSDSFKLFTDSQFASFVDYKKYWIAGLQTQPSYVESYGESKMMVIQFKTFGAYIFLNQPLRYFINQYVELDCIFKREADAIWDQLKEAKYVSHKISIVEEFLFSKLKTRKFVNEKLITSVSSIFKSRNNVSIKELCQQHNISRKHLNFLFQEYLGVSPKMFSSLNRFQSILQTITYSRPEKLTSIAYELEFFDQAHFNNDFKRFTGLKPNAYVRSVETIPSLKILPHFLPVA